MKDARLSSAGMSELIQLVPPRCCSTKMSFKQTLRTCCVTQRCGNETELHKKPFPQLDTLIRSKTSLKGAVTGASNSPSAWLPAAVRKFSREAVQYLTPFTSWNRLSVVLLAVGCRLPASKSISKRTGSHLFHFSLTTIN